MSDGLHTHCTAHSTHAVLGYWREHARCLSTLSSFLFYTFNHATSCRAYRLTWAALLARVFQNDVSVCPACGRKMKIIAFITDPASIRRYLEGVGLPTAAPPIAPARSPPQTVRLLIKKTTFTKRPLPGLWIRASRGTKCSLRQNLYNEKGCSSKVRTTLPPPGHHSPSTIFRFTV